MILNLSDNFEPYGKGIEYKKFEFPSGCEPHIKLDALGIRDDSYLITVRISSMNDAMLLLLATDALRRCGVNKISVFMPYLPFARQDRVMVSGEPLSLKVFANILNAQNYERVIVYDVHSEISLALINNSASVSNHSFVFDVLKDNKDYLIISPDAGAYKKIFSLCKYINYTDEIVLCNKIRDVATGNIKSISVSNQNMHGKDVYIVDDICDGGATFIHLAEELKECGAGNICLIVSHGIFSKGLSPLLKNISHIYCTNSFSDYTKMQTEVDSANSTHFTQIKLDHKIAHIN